MIWEFSPFLFFSKRDWRHCEVGYVNWPLTNVHKKYWALDLLRAIFTIFFSRNSNCHPRIGNGNPYFFRFGNKFLTLDTFFIKAVACWRNFEGIIGPKEPFTDPYGVYQYLLLNYPFAKKGPKSQFLFIWGHNYATFYKTKNSHFTIPLKGKN